MYPPELSRIAGFCTNSNKKFSGGGPPDPPFKQNCLRLFYNHNTAHHLKKLNTYQNLPPPHHFSGELKIKWSLYVLFEKSIVDHFFVNGCLKEQRKVLEKSLKMYLKSPWKVLEKGMSWSVGTMKSPENPFALHTICLYCSPIHSPWIQKEDTHSLIKFWKVHGIGQVCDFDFWLSPVFSLHNWEIFLYRFVCKYFQYFPNKASMACKIWIKNILIQLLKHYCYVYMMQCISCLCLNECRCWIIIVVCYKTCSKCWCVRYLDF